MKTILPCPYCNEKTVIGAKKVNLIRGLLIVFQHGHRIVIGCRSCLQTQTAKSALGNLLLGWWSVYGLFLTPLFFAQNVFTLFSKPRDAFLRETLKQTGIFPNDYEVDASGYSKAERSFHAGILNVLVRSAWSDGRLDPAEIAASLSHGKQFLPETFLEKEIEFRLRNQDAPPLHADVMPLELKVLLFRIAIEIIRSDGRVEPNEIQFLNDLGRELRFSVYEIEDLMRFAGLGGGHSQSPSNEHSSELQWAADTLGITPTTSAFDAKKTYRKRCLDSHPDRIQGNAEETAKANRRMADLNKAYAIFTKHGRI